jgi:hypothetical protein
MTTVRVRFQPGLRPKIEKHAMHDQQAHGNWAGQKTGGGNNLNLQEAAKLINRFDPLQKEVYAAEASLDKQKTDSGTKPKAPLPQNYPLDKRDEYDKAYKEYNKKFVDWAVEQQSDLLTDLGKKTLDGSPRGVKKYIDQVVKTDWFVEKFGDGSSLPPLEVKAANTNAAGRHILRMTRNRSTGGIVKQENIISIDRQFTKDEALILHEVSHFATAISQTTPYAGHGVEFAKNHVYVIGKAVSPERATKLKKAYEAKGIQIDN